MARTYRNSPEYSFFRRPKTSQERSKNAALKKDQQLEDEYYVTKANRRNRFIPTAWDDLRRSTD
jgi:hypothetical protein